MAVRACEDCGRKMSPWEPRKRRDDGAMACKACLKEPGGGTVYGQPKQAARPPWIGSDTWDDAPGGPSVLRKAAIRDTHTLLVKVVLAYDTDQTTGYAAQQGFLEGLPERLGAVTIHSAEIVGGLLDADDAPVGPRVSRKVAHEMTDEQEIGHCAFCGSGQVVGRSDGTVECGFCNRFFTVRLQPEFPATPQTVDGVPQPGFEPTETDPQPPVEGEAEPDAEVEGEGEGESTPSTSPKQAPPWEQPPAFARRYRTSNGHLLDADAYQRHLAIAHADDPAVVLPLVRAASRPHKERIP